MFDTYTIKRRDMKEVLWGSFKDPTGLEICKTLENPYLDNKPFLSAIPCGLYNVRKYTSPPGSKKDYRNIWQVIDVPGRDLVLIHNGNTESDTTGCILVGEKLGILNDQLAVLSSKKTLTLLQQRLPDSFKLRIC
jgi:hypothetical protein